ncbi:tetratricopeptide repeat protein [Robiginitalea sp.]|uniref:tetratricopeptide repeat protein n=1 Tax=Robiginitalea sp. TaxID=1902411 RepID=UPI003C714142
MKNFEDYIAEAEGLLQANRPEEAVHSFESALKVVPTTLLKMQIGNTVARIRELTGARPEAAAQFLEVLEAPQSEAPEIQEQRALSLNNLGRLSLPEDPEAAIGYFNQSIAIYTALSEADSRYCTHHAHSLMARGEAYYLRKKYWYSKKDYKAALELNRRHTKALDADMEALAHYQLGAIYTDEFNAYDAQSNYQKALDRYLEGASENPRKYRPLVAACQNNLAVSHLQLEGYDKAVEHYRKTLEAYQWLCQEKPETFLPYLAATYSSLGILYADKKNQYSEALLAGQKAIALYENLSESSPDKYRHYLATAYHNSGIYALETPQWKDAFKDLLRALEMRKELTNRDMEAFGADYCVTALNILEFYQRQLEVEKDIQFRIRGLELLAEMKPVLMSLPESPTSANMKNDFDFLGTYFNGIDAEEIQTLGILENMRLWDQEIDSTLDLKEKASYQARILASLDDFFKNFPENKTLRKPFALALNNMGWLCLCEGAVGEARKLLNRAAAHQLDLPAIVCNLAHCDLLEGHASDALARYEKLYGQKNESNTDFHKVIQEDVSKLKSYNVIPEEVFQTLETAGILKSVK